MATSVSVGRALAGERSGPAVAGHVWPVVTLLALGALVRLVLWLGFAPLPIYVDDEQDYNALAVNLVESGTFGYEAGKPKTLRPPLYPAFVSVVYRLCGVQNYQAVRLAQAGLSLVTVLLVYWLGRLAVSPKVGFVAAALYCFYPSMLGLNNLLLTEGLFTFFLVGACVAVAVYYRKGSLAAVAAAGVLLGLAALTRSVVYLTPPLLAVFLLLTGKRGPFGGLVPEGFAEIGFGKRLLAGLLLCLTFAATLAPWAIRNTQLEGTFIPVDTMGGRNLMMGNYARTPLYRAWDAISLRGEDGWFHALLQVRPEIATDPTMTQGKIDKLAMAEGLRYVRANPGQTAARDLVKFLDFWGLERELVSRAAAGGFGQLPPGSTVGLAVLIFGSYAALLFLGIYGAVLAPPADRRIHWFLVAVVVYVTAVHSVVFGHSRYHLPLMPIVLVYAGCALVSWRAVWERKRSLGFALATGVCLFLVLGWGWNAVAGDWDKAAGVLRRVF